MSVTSLPRNALRWNLVWRDLKGEIPVEVEKQAICSKKISVLPRGTTFFARFLEGQLYFLDLYTSETCMLLIHACYNTHSRMSNTMADGQNPKTTWDICILVKNSWPIDWCRISVTKSSVRRTTVLWFIQKSCIAPTTCWDLSNP